MGELTVTVNEQKSPPCALWHMLNSQWNRQGKSHDRLSSNFPPEVFSRLQLPEALYLYVWELLRGCLIDSERWVIHQRELGTDHANMCDLVPKTVLHLVYLFGKNNLQNPWKTKAGVEIALNISSVQTKTQSNKPIVWLTCSVKTSQLLMLNSWVAGEPVPE